jgi:hypothetical protein
MRCQYHPPFVLLQELVIPLDTMLGRPQSRSAGNWSWFLGLPMRDLLALRLRCTGFQLIRYCNTSSTDQTVSIIKICWYMTPFRLVNNLDVSVEHSTFNNTMKYSRGLEPSSALLWQITILLIICCFYTEFKSLLDPMRDFGGLEVACWPSVPKFAGSNLAEAVGILGRKNPQHTFLRRGSKAACPMCFTACKRTQKWRGSRHFRQNSRPFLVHISTFRCWVR